MLKIGEFSRLGQVTVKTLRHYDQIGLLKPANVDTFTGYRYYTAAQLNRLHQIRALKELDLSLEQIRRILDGGLTNDQLRGMLKMKAAELATGIEEKTAQLDRVEAQLRQLNLEETMTEKVTIKEVPGMRVLAYRSIIPDTSYIGKMVEDANAAVRKQKVPLAETDWLSLYYHDEFRTRELDFEIAIPVAEGFEGALDLGEGRVLTVRELPACTMACLDIHYDGIESVRAGNRALARWVEEHGYEYEDLACRESYPPRKSDDEPLIFETQFPIKVK